MENKIIEETKIYWKTRNLCCLHSAKKVLKWSIALQFVRESVKFNNKYLVQLEKFVLFPEILNILKIV